MVKQFLSTKPHKTPKQWRYAVRLKQYGLSVIAADLVERAKELALLDLHHEGRQLKDIALSLERLARRLN